MTQAEVYAGFGLSGGMQQLRMLGMRVALADQPDSIARAAKQNIWGWWRSVTAGSALMPGLEASE